MSRTKRINAYEDFKSGPLSSYQREYNSLAVPPQRLSGHKITEPPVCNTERCPHFSLHLIYPACAICTHLDDERVCKLARHLGVCEMGGSDRFFLWQDTIPAGNTMSFRNDPLFRTSYGFSHTSLRIS